MTDGGAVEPESEPEDVPLPAQLHAFHPAHPNVWDSSFQARQVWNVPDVPLPKDEWCYEGDDVVIFEPLCADRWVATYEYDAVDLAEWA